MGFDLGLDTLPLHDHDGAHVHDHGHGYGDGHGHGDPLFFQSRSGVHGHVGISRRVSLLSNSHRCNLGSPAVLNVGVCSSFPPPSGGAEVSPDDDGGDDDDLDSGFSWF